MISKNIFLYTALLLGSGFALGQDWLPYMLTVKDSRLHPVAATIDAASGTILVVTEGNKQNRENEESTPDNKSYRGSVLRYSIGEDTRVGDLYTVRLANRLDDLSHPKSIQYDHVREAVYVCTEIKNPNAPSSYNIVRYGDYMNRLRISAIYKLDELIAPGTTCEQMLIAGDNKTMLFTSKARNNGPNGISDEVAVYSFDLTVYPKNYYDSTVPSFKPYLRFKDINKEWFKHIHESNIKLDQIEECYGLFVISDDNKTGRKIFFLKTEYDYENTNRLTAPTEDTIEIKSATPYQNIGNPIDLHLRNSDVLHRFESIILFATYANNKPVSECNLYSLVVYPRGPITKDSTYEMFLSSKMPSKYNQEKINRCYGIAYYYDSVYSITYNSESNNPMVFYRTRYGI